MTAVSDRLAKAAEALLADKYLSDPINADRMADLRGALEAYQAERAALAMPPIVGVPVIVPDDAHRGVLHKALHWHGVGLEKLIAQALKRGQGQSQAYADLDEERRLTDYLRSGLMGGVYQARLAAAHVHGPQNTGVVATSAAGGQVRKPLIEEVGEVLARMTGMAEVNCLDDSSNEWRSAIIDANGALKRFDAERRAEPAYVVVQEGGSSGELYIHSSPSEEDAVAFRESCADAAYRTSGVIEVPAALAAHGEELYVLLEAVAVGTNNLDVFEPEEGMKP